jgi:hypothetical protein
LILTGTYCGGAVLLGASDLIPCEFCEIYNSPLSKQALI